MAIPVIFQHGCSNPVRDSLWNLFFSIKEKPSLIKICTLDLFLLDARSTIWAIIPDIKNIFAIKRWLLQRSETWQCSVNHILVFSVLMLLPFCTLRYCLQQKAYPTQKCKSQFITFEIEFAMLIQYKRQVCPPIIFMIH